MVINTWHINNVTTNYNNISTPNSRSSSSACRTNLIFKSVLRIL